MIFSQRTTQPATMDKHWIHTSRGGLNECIRISGDSVLPNCVGYAWGRAYEIMNSRPKLAKTNAKTWYGNTSDGYQRGSAPKLGAIACWDGKYGHVAVVESIGSDYIMVSQSNYGGTRFEYCKCTKMSNGGYKSSGGMTSFQGFIYLPIVITATQSGTNNGAAVKASKPAYSFSNDKARTYTATANLRVRNGGSLTDSVLGVMPRGTKFKCYGYFTGAFLYGVCTFGGRTYTGFASGRYLK